MTNNCTKNTKQWIMGWLQKTTGIKKKKKKKNPTHNGETCLLKKKKVLISQLPSSCALHRVTEAKFYYPCWALVSSNRLSINANSNLIRPRQGAENYHILHTLQYCNIKLKMKLLLYSPYVKVELTGTQASSSFVFF